MTIHSKFENESIIKELRSRTIELNKGIIKDNSRTRSNINSKFLDSEKKICINKFIENINGNYFNIYCNKKLEDLEQIKYYTYAIIFDCRNNDDKTILWLNNLIEGLIIYIGESKKKGEPIFKDKKINILSRIGEHLNINNKDNRYLKDFIKFNKEYGYVNNIYLKIIEEKFNNNCINELEQFINYFKHFPRNTYGSIITRSYCNIDEKKENILNDLIKEHKTAIGIYNYLKKNKHKFKSDWNNELDWTKNRILNRIYNSINGLQYFCTIDNIKKDNNNFK